MARIQTFVFAPEKKLGFASACGQHYEHKGKPPNKENHNHTGIQVRNLREQVWEDRVGLRQLTDPAAQGTRLQSQSIGRSASYSLQA